MGSILLSVPEIEDSELVFNEEETKLILKFFYSQEASTIDSLKINNDLRRWAQTLLIAGIDGSYAMGFIDDLGQVLLSIIEGGKNPGIKGLAKKLAKKFVKRWWHHATQSKLEDVAIYEAIRHSIAVKTRPQFLLLIGSDATARVGAKNGLRIFVATNDRRAWG